MNGLIADGFFLLSVEQNIETFLLPACVLVTLKRGGVSLTVSRDGRLLLSGEG